jgi:hypothetical protein
MEELPLVPVKLLHSPGSPRASAYCGPRHRFTADAQVAAGVPYDVV